MGDDNWWSLGEAITACKEAGFEVDAELLRDFLGAGALVARQEKKTRSWRIQPRSLMNFLRYEWTSARR